MRSGFLIGFLFVLFASKAAFAQQEVETSDVSYNQAASSVSDVLSDEEFADRAAPQQSRGGSRYEWVLSYIDRSGGFQSCDFSCNAPRCSSDTVQLRKACRVPNTKDDNYVYTCTYVGRDYGR